MLLFAGMYRSLSADSTPRVASLCRLQCSGRTGALFRARSLGLVDGGTNRSSSQST